MNAVIQIECNGVGRDAIPVRALPWLTDWWFGAQEVAEALEQDKENYPEFANLQAYRLNGELVEPVPGREWRNTVSWNIQNILDKDLPNDQWRREAIAAMPAGAFVWRDQWEPAYNSSPDGPDCLAALDDDPDAAQDRENRALNFDPMVPPEFERLAADGFVQSESAPAPQVDPTAVKHVTNGRGQGAIAGLIEDIRRATNGIAAALIWEKLKTFASAGNDPFTGLLAGEKECAVKPGSLAYTNVENSISWYTRKNLTDYLGRQKKRK
jgi:hypothetical protein